MLIEDKSKVTEKSRELPRISSAKRELAVDLYKKSTCNDYAAVRSSLRVRGRPTGAAEKPGRQTYQYKRRGGDLALTTSPAW